MRPASRGRRGRRGRGRPDQVPRPARHVGPRPVRPEAMQRPQARAPRVPPRDAHPAEVPGRRPHPFRHRLHLTRGLPPHTRGRTLRRGLLVESPRRRAVEKAALRGAAAAPVDGRRQPGQLRQAVQAQLRRGTVRRAVHQRVQRGGGAVDEQVQVGPRFHHAQQGLVGVVRCVHYWGGGFVDAEQVAHRGRAQAPAADDAGKRLRVQRRRERRRE
mmetsp:Transcript_9524/g.43389  ORF Transcript_9524/g.43389 Transcript_9524/m.43389 type:complete len:215 (-) Transcript_9524:136-780(-)